MRADQIQARAVAKIVVVALIWAAVAVLIAIALLHTPPRSSGWRRPSSSPWPSTQR